MQIHDRKFKKAGNFKLRLIFFAVFEVKMTIICRYLNSAESPTLKKMPWRFVGHCPTLSSLAYKWPFPLRVEITIVCDVHTYTVMNIRFTVIYESKV
jgi:hypothetical protein